MSIIVSFVKLIIMHITGLDVLHRVISFDGIYGSYDLFFERRFITNLQIEFFDIEVVF